MMKDTFRACLLGSAIGDALGYPVEGYTRTTSLFTPRQNEEFVRLKLYTKCEGAYNMKKLNMNSAGMTYIGWGSLFLVISLLLYFIQCIVGSNRILSVAMWISAVTGVIILLILFALVFIEVRQDKTVDKFFKKNVHAKIRISGSYFECQNCGNQKVLENQTSCPVCGITFKEKQKAPFDIFY